MAQKTIGGVTGVLGDLLSAASPSDLIDPSVSNQGSSLDRSVIRQEVEECSVTNVETCRGLANGRNSLSPPGTQKTPARQTAGNMAKRHARRGRPPGRCSSQNRPKEKVTLRIDVGLIAFYRELSWERRCQLGELVTEALEFYRVRR